MSWRWVADIYPARWVWEQTASKSQSRLQRSLVCHYNHGHTIEEREKGRERCVAGCPTEGLPPNNSSARTWRHFPDWLYCCHWHMTVSIVMTCTWRYNYNVMVWVCCICHYLYLYTPASTVLLHSSVTGGVAKTLCCPMVRDEEQQSYQDLKILFQNTVRLKWTNSNKQQNKCDVPGISKKKDIPDFTLRKMDVSILHFHGVGQGSQLPLQLLLLLLLTEDEGSAWLLEGKALKCGSDHEWGISD